MYCTRRIDGEQGNERPTDLLEEIRFWFTTEVAFPRVVAVYDAFEQVGDTKESKHPHGMLRRGRHMKSVSSAPLRKRQEEGKERRSEKEGQTSQYFRLEGELTVL